MNILNFRFWNKREERFSRTVTPGMGYHDYYIHISDLGGLIGVNHNGIQDLVIDLDEDDFDIQQCANIKDKNGYIKALEVVETFFENGDLIK